MKRFLGTQNGFSLLELILGAAISVILVVILTQFVGIISNIQKYLGAKLPTQADVEQALQTAVVEIRSIGQSSAGAFPIEVASSTTLTFFSDIDRDGLMDRVRYTIASGTLQKGVVRPVGNPITYPSSSETVSFPVANLLGSQSSFAYYDTNFTGTEAALAYPIDVTAIRSVFITFTADVSTTTTPRATTLSTLVTIRNLKSN